MLRVPFIAGACLLLVEGVALSESTPSPTVEIYRLDGTRQCMPGTGHSLEADAKLANSAGVSEILAESKKRIPRLVPALCGAPTGLANVFTIRRKDWEAHSAALRALPLGFDQWPYDVSEVKVFRYTGELQCFGGGEAIDVVQKELEAAHIKYSNPQTATDGLMHIQLCGASSGKIFVFTIAASDFERASKLGFRLVDDLKPISRVVAGKPPYASLSAAAGGDDDLSPWPW